MDYREYETAITGVNWMALFLSDKDRAEFQKALKAGGEAIRTIETLKDMCAEIQRCGEG